MTTHEQLSREEVAQREIGRTGVTRRQAAVVMAVFLGVITAVPLVQWGIDRSAEPAERPGWSEVIQAWRLGALPRTVGVGERSGWREASLLRRLKVANDQLLVNIHRFEDDQREASFLTRSLVTPFQRLTTRTLGLGNEQGYPGREGWAFFRAGLDSVTGPGFLDPRQLARRAASGTEWEPAPEPDPRPAILEFHRYLSGRGIDLVLVPVPVKPVIHPERFSRRYEGETEPILNPSHRDWLREMATAGITVVDPVTILMERKASGPQFLETDTHWRPAAMEAVAEAIAEAVGPVSATTALRRSEREVSALGDVAANLLRLKDTGVYPEQTVTIRPVETADGDPWRPSKRAELLLLGDSFATIYSVTNMNWGGHAGLPEQLAHAWQGDVDVIAINDAGARATREALAKDLRRGDRLADTRVVVWEFASRELAVGDWARIDWDAIEIGTAADRPATEGWKTVRGQIEAISRPPVPGSVTYKDCLVQAHLVDISGLNGEEEVVVNLWGMRDNVWTEVARWEPGIDIELAVMDWSRAREEEGVKGLMRRELEDPDFVLIELPLYYGTPGDGRPEIGD